MKRVWRPGKGGIGAGQEGRQLKQKVERELRGRRRNRGRFYFKRYHSQMSVIERAIETATLHTNSFAATAATTPKRA